MDPWLFAGLVTAISGGVGVGVFVCLPRIDVYLVERHRRRAISAEVQAEIDQTPEWWEKQFDALLRKVDGPRIETRNGISYAPLKPSLVRGRRDGPPRHRLTGQEYVLHGNEWVLPKTLSDPQPPTTSEVSHVWGRKLEESIAAMELLRMGFLTQDEAKKTIELKATRL